MKCLKLYILKEDGYLKNRLTKFELIASKYTFSFLSFLVPGMVYQPGGSALGIELKKPQCHTYIPAIQERKYIFSNYPVKLVAGSVAL